jgi:hypothetical protein
MTQIANAASSVRTPTRAPVEPGTVYGKPTRPTPFSFHLPPWNTSSVESPSRNNRGSSETTVGSVRLTPSSPDRGGPAQDRVSGVTDVDMPSTLAANRRESDVTVSETMDGSREGVSVPPPRMPDGSPGRDQPAADDNGAKAHRERPPESHEAQRPLKRMRVDFEDGVGGDAPAGVNASAFHPGPIGWEPLTESEREAGLDGKTTWRRHVTLSCILFEFMLRCNYKQRKKETPEDR